MNGYYYDNINSALRSGDLKDYSCYIDGLKQSLRKLPEYKGWVIRGTDLPPKVLARHVPGKIVRYLSFTSATIGDGINEYFRDQPMEIKILSKHARDISDLNNDEGEVIFQPGTRFRVLSRKDPSGDDQVTHISLEEIEPKASGKNQVSASESTPTF
jgi:hypothetical protein